MPEQQLQPQIRHHLQKQRFKPMLFLSCLSALFFTQIHSQTVTPTRFYDFTQLKAPGVIGDQRNLALAANDINIQATEQLTGWGLPMTGSTAEQSNSQHITKPSFTISGWYYSCAAASYTVFCKQDSSGSVEQTYLCLEVDSDSTFIITLMLSGVETMYQVRPSSFKAVSGWTWFAITVEEVYGNSVLSFYAAHDSYSGLIAPGPPAKLEKVTLIGFYTDPAPNPNIEVYFGCRRNVKGVCYRSMVGYFYYLKVWAQTALTLGNLASEITGSCGNAGCTVCHIDNKCFSQRNVLIYELDLEQNTQQISSQKPLSTFYQFQLGDTSSQDLETDPIRVPFQGLRFSKGKYIQSLNTPMVPIPQIFTVEAWLRFDADNPGQYGDLQYIYEIQRNQQRFAIALDNSYLKVIINGYEVTYFSNWLSNTGWRYLAVSVVKTYTDTSGGAEIASSQVKVYLDRVLATTMNIPSFFQDDQSDATKVSDTIGRSFRGVIRMIRLQSSMFCGAQQSPSISTMCAPLGSTSSCPICDASAPTCFSTCKFNTLDEKCTPCDWKCKSCLTTATNCQECNTQGSLVGVAPVCACAAGYVQVGSQCMQCHPQCSTCLDTTNFNCPVCDTQAYLFGSGLCLRSCPYGYKEDLTYHLCHFDTNKLTQPQLQLPYLNFNCSSDQYFALSGKGVCSQCDSSCQTCSGGSDLACTSCALGKYLMGGRCLTCDPQGMVLGSSGECVEKCGDGLNFGLLQCDDGNAIDGDGCNHLCEIELDWTCQGGSPTSKDVCTFVDLDIVAMEVTPNNNLILQFNKPAYVTGQLFQQDDFDIKISRYDGTPVTNFESDFNIVREMPATRIFISLKIKDFLQGEDKRSRIEVIYKRSNKIFDERLRELSSGAYAIGYLNKQVPYVPDSDNTILRALAIASNFSLVFGFIFTLILAAKYQTSSQQAFLMLYGQQEILYTLLMSYDFPINMKNFWRYFTWVQLELNFLPNVIRDGFMDMSQIRQGDYAENFQFLNFVADSFLVNAHLKIYIWFFYTLAFVISLCLMRKCTPERKQAISDTFLYSGTVQLFLCCMMPFGYASFIEIQQLSKTLPYKLTSVASSFFILATLLFFLYSTSIIGMRAKTNYYNPRFQSMYGSLLKEFTCNTPSLMYYAIFSWKRFGQIIATAIFISSPGIQTFMVAAFQAIFLLYVSITRPFISAYNNVLSFFSQLFPLLITIYSTVFSDSRNDPQTAYNNGWGSILILSVYCLMYLVISVVAVCQTIMEKHEEDARYRYLVEMKIKVVLVRLFTQQGVRDELLAKADGVEYVSKAGSSLTVITRTKSQDQLTSRKSGDGLDWGTSGTQSMFKQTVSNGELRLPDDDEMLDNQSPIMGLKTPLSGGFGDLSPVKGAHAEMPLINPIEIKKPFNGPMGVGGNELPGIFNHKPKIDARMMATPTALNRIAYPKVEEIEGAKEMLAKFDDNQNHHDDGFDTIAPMGKNTIPAKTAPFKGNDAINSIVNESIRDTSNVNMLPPIIQPIPVEAVVEELGNENDDLLTQKASTKRSKKVKKKVKVKKKKYKGGGVLVEEEVEV